MASMMARMMSNAFAMAGLTLLLGSLSGAALADGPWPSLDSPELGHGPYSFMHMMLQKTIFSINVATIDVRVDKQVQARLADQARDKTYSDALAPQLAQTVMGAERAVVQMQFVRNVSLNRWMGVVHDSLEQARHAGLIDAGLERRVKDGLPQWFAALKDRGYEKGDRLIYSVIADGTRTMVVSASSQILVDRVDTDPGARRVVLTSYFAPESDFREPLLRSLLEKKP
jgi:phosphoserine phosphatase